MRPFRFLMSHSVVYLVPSPVVHATLRRHCPAHVSARRGSRHMMLALMRSAMSCRRSRTASVRVRFSGGCCLLDSACHFARLAVDLSVSTSKFHCVSQGAYGLVSAVSSVCSLHGRWSRRLTMRAMLRASSRPGSCSRPRCFIPRPCSMPCMVVRLAPHVAEVYISFTSTKRWHAAGIGMRFRAT